MKDETIVRMLQESCQVLARVRFPVSCPHLGPYYNALLRAAKANHPDDVFLSALPPIEDGEAAGPEELNVLFAQLRIAVESLQPDGAALGASETALVPRGGATA